MVQAISYNDKDKARIHGETLQEVKLHLKIGRIAAKGSGIRFSHNHDSNATKENIKNDSNPTPERILLPVTAGRNNPRG